MIPKRPLVTNDISIFVSTIVLLAVIGTIFVYSSSSVFALEKHGSVHYFFKRHLIGLCIALTAAVVIQLLPTRHLKSYSLVLLVFSLALTAATLIPHFAPRIHGSYRWLNLAGFLFQPSELIKITFVAYLAAFLSKKRIGHPSFVPLYGPLLIITAIIGLILLKQPDFGLTVTLCTTMAIMLFAANFHIRFLMYTVSAAIPIVIGLIWCQPYRMRRILTFLDPWKDPQGAGFQLIQSLIAIGSGGICGVGIGHSKQKFFYLPMQHTDFIFSIIAEETGFIGSIIIINLYLVLLWSGIRIAKRLSDPFCQLFSFGTVVLINLQALINIGVATAFLPTKGTGLPLISYGNTSLICTIVMLSIVLKMARDQIKQTATSRYGVT